MVANNNTDPNRPFLEFPRTYFAPKSGAGPKDKDDALRWWEWRESRRMGLSDEVPCGFRMMKEIATTRASLRSYIGSEYLQVLKKRCNKFGLVNASTGENAILSKDINTALSTLPNTPENNEMIYNIFFKFHKNRKWSALTIDKWMFSRQMTLQPQVAQAGVKKYLYNRGGFMDVARHAKSNKIAKFKNYLFNNQRWTIALSLPSTKQNKKKKNYVPKEYRKVIVPPPPIDPEDDTPQDDKEYFYYVVTERLTPDDDDDIDIDNRLKADIDELLDIDYVAIAKKLKTTVKAVRNALAPNVYYLPNNGSNVTGLDNVDATGANDNIMDEANVTGAEAVAYAMSGLETDLSGSNNAPPPPTNAEELNAEATASKSPPPAPAPALVPTTPPLTSATDSTPPPPTNAEELNAEATASKSPPPAPAPALVPTTPPLTSATDSTPPPPTNAEELNAEATASKSPPPSPSNGKKRNSPSSKIPGYKYMPPRVRTPTPPRYGSHLFTSSISPTNLYADKNSKPSPKRKTPSGNKKKSKVSKVRQ